MAQPNFIANELDYGRELLQAGIDGLRAGEQEAITAAGLRLSNSVRESLKAAAVGGTLAFLMCKLVDRRKAPLPSILACSGAVFCADFAWRTRNVSSRALKCAEHEISKVRDQHWLDSHPIDYA